MPPLGFDKLASCTHDAIKTTFGEEVIYSPTGLADVTLVGVFNIRHEVVDPDLERVVSSNQPNLGVKRVDLPKDPEKNEIFTIRGKQYRIYDSQEDGEGWIKLLLYEVA